MQRRSWACGGAQPGQPQAPSEPHLGPPLCEAPTCPVHHCDTHGVGTGHHEASVVHHLVVEFLVPVCCHGRWYTGQRDTPPPRNTTQPLTPKCIWGIDHVSSLLYLRLHMYKRKSNMTCLILQNVPQLPCVTVGSISLICGARKQAKNIYTQPCWQVVLHYTRIYASVNESI